MLFASKSGKSSKPVYGWTFLCYYSPLTCITRITKPKSQNQSWKSQKQKSNEILTNYLPLIVAKLQPSLTALSNALVSITKPRLLLVS